MKKRIFTLFPFYIAVFLITSSCVVQESPITGTKRAYAYSWQQEVQIGNEVDPELVSEFGLYEDEVIAEYVVDISKKLLENSHMRREGTSDQFRETEFTFRVLDSPVVNAFALPGGFVYVTRGLMAHMNNEAQLAVVLGHEIGHVAARHASQRGLQQAVGQVLVVGGAILGQELLGLPGQGIVNLSGQAAQLVFLRYSRDHERESDRLGVEYAARSGYAAEEGAAFFTSLKRISERSGQAIPTLLSSHPDPGERELNIPRQAEQWKEQGFDGNVRNTDEYLRRLDGMIFGDNPRNGFVDNGRFVHPDLEFQYPVPSGWQVINQPAQVVFVSPENNAVMILRIDSESSTARESVQKFIAQDGIDIQSQSSAESSSRWPAYQADVVVQDGEGTLGVHVYAVEYQNRVYRFINYTERQRFDDFKDNFTASTRGFDALTDQRILNTNPVRLSIVEVSQNRRFRDLLPSSLPMDIDAEEVAIINQVHLDDMIEAGTLIKIPTQ